MKHQWRLLLFRRSHRSFLTHYSHLQVISNSTRPFSSFLHKPSGIGQCLFSLRSPLTSSVTRSFSSKPATEEKPSPEALVIDVFTRLSGKNEIKKELNSNDIVISYELALNVLRSLESNPDIAKKFFDWISETSPKKLSSKSYNTMLRILGVNGLIDEFWRLVDAMKKKGHGVSANVRDKVSEKFQKDGLENDLIKLKELFASGSMDNSFDKVCNRVCKIVMKEKQWSSEVEKQLRELKLDFDNGDLVKMIVEKLDLDTRKALLFFRWIDESGSFKHNEKTYNAMARVLGKEKYLDRFWNIIEEMRSLGYEMEMETYVRVSARFCQSRMIREAVELFEFAMSANSTNTPTAHCCSLLLKKIIAGRKLDMDLFSRTVKAYTGNGSVITNTMLQHVLKSLRSVDGFGESNEVLKAMKESGCSPSGDLQSAIASGLIGKGKKDEANEVVNFIGKVLKVKKESGFSPSSDLESAIASGIIHKEKKDEANELVNFMEATGDHKAMVTLIERHCNAKNLEEALNCFKKMISKEGEGEVSYSGYAFEQLVLAYCNGFKARDAYTLFAEVLKNNQLKPWHSSYKIMIRNLLREGGFEEALSLLPLMKNHGFPPFVDPFLDYLANSGTSGEALAFLKAVSSKKFPSNAMVLRVFEALLKTSRHREAQDLLSRCPSYIRSNAEVLELLHSMKPDMKHVDRLGESNEVLKENGYSPSGDLQSAISSGLSRKGKKDEANELVNFMEESKAMASLVERHCDANNLEEASECFKKMISKEGEGKGEVSYSGYAFEKLVLAYCNEFKARDAYKLFIEVNSNNQLKPWHTTYEDLVSYLLASEGGFEEALSLLPLMKNQGFTPFVDPFLDYLPISGTRYETIVFLKTVTSKEFPSIPMVLRLIEDFLKESRRSEAEDVLRQCPSYIRLNREVLELICK